MHGILVASSSQLIFVLTPSQSSLYSPSKLGNMHFMSVIGRLSTHGKHSRPPIIKCKHPQKKKKPKGSSDAMQRAFCQPHATPFQKPLQMSSYLLYFSFSFKENVAVFGLLLDNNPASWTWPVRSSQRLLGCSFLLRQRFIMPPQVNSAVA